MCWFVICPAVWGKRSSPAATAGWLPARCVGRSIPSRPYPFVRALSSWAISMPGKRMFCFGNILTRFCTNLPFLPSLRKGRKGLTAIMACGKLLTISWSVPPCWMLAPVSARRMGSVPLWRSLSCANRIRPTAASVRSALIKARFTGVATATIFPCCWISSGGSLKSDGRLVLRLVPCMEGERRNTRILQGLSRRQGLGTAVAKADIIHDDTAHGSGWSCRGRFVLRR